MAIADNYSSIIIRILKQYFDVSHQYQNVESKLIIGEDNKDFLIFIYGRHDTEPVHECILHIQIEGEKILIRRNDLELDLFTKLSQAGVSNLNIIYPDIPERKITNYTISLEKIYELHSFL